MTGGLHELALFAGAGGGILGGTLLGWRTVCAVEIEPYPASVLLQRQNDGFLPSFPIWDDVRTFDGKPWRGIIDVVSGGFPCQDISAAGKGAGITGKKSGLWVEMARIIGEVRPRYVFVENSPRLTSRGLGVVLGDLASMGYDSRWGILGAADVGAPHLRERIWIVANDDCNDRRTDSRESNARSDGRHELAGCVADVCHIDSERLEERKSQPSDDGEKQPAAIRADWWAIEPDMVRVVHGFPGRVDQIKALGNAQVPAVATTAFKLFSN